jgi:hypothetical protein
MQRSKLIQELITDLESVDVGSEVLAQMVMKSFIFCV